MGDILTATINDTFTTYVVVYVVRRTGRVVLKGADGELTEPIEPDRLLMAAPLARERFLKRRARFNK
jgi:hypothetical protein